MLQVGRVPETLRVREHIDLFSTYYRRHLPIADVLAAAGLEKLRDRKFGELSGGQKQRVCLRWRAAAIRILFFSTTHG